MKLKDSIDHASTKPGQENAKKRGKGGKKQYTIRNTTIQISNSQNQDYPLFTKYTALESIQHRSLN